MDQSPSPTDPLARGRALLIGGLGLALFVALAVWGGTPPADQMTAFITGVIILAAVVGLFVYAAWYLLVKPLPAGHKAPEGHLLSVTARRLLAVLVAISGINLVVGGFWDEVWHRQYGIPFGEDFFWRPHLLLYSSILTIAALSLGSLVILLRRGRGSLQQRFRAEPVMGLLVLTGGFMFVALPADPVWHLIYGDDLSAWSIPHLVVTLSFTLVMLLAVAIQLSTIAPRPWQRILRLKSEDLLVVLVLASVMLINIQAMTTDWDGLDLATLQRRPEWLLPAVIVTMATLLGTLANHALRYVGAASVIGLTAVLLRLGLIAVFDVREMSAWAWVAALPPMIALDVWYGLHLSRRRQPPDWITTGLAALLGLALISFALINRAFVYPQISLGNLLPMLMATFIAATGAAWVGRQAGDFLATANKDTAGEPEAVADRRLRLVPPLALLAVVAFMVVFIATASPPV